MLGPAKAPPPRPADRRLAWYLDYALDEALPDHSSLIRIRQRLGIDLFQRFFEKVVDLCQEADLVWGRELYFDATEEPVSNSATAPEAGTRAPLRSATNASTHRTGAHEVGASPRG